MLSQAGACRARDSQNQEVTGTSWTNRRMDLKSTEKPQRRFKMDKIKFAFKRSLLHGSGNTEGWLQGTQETVLHGSLRVRDIDRGPWISRRER